MGIPGNPSRTSSANIPLWWARGHIVKHMPSSSQGGDRRIVAAGTAPLDDHSLLQGVDEARPDLVPSSQQHTLSLSSDDPLRRFVDAQETSFGGALAELVQGRKRGHWIWFILPQETRPGVSSMSSYYAITSDDEGVAYLRHPLLGPRYLQLVDVIHRQLCRNGVTPSALMGSSVDVMKLRSSLALFVRVADASFGQDMARFREQARELLSYIG